MPTKTTLLPPLEIFPLEKFAGDFDLPCYEGMATVEAIEQAEPSGGRHTFGSSGPADRAAELESGTDRLFEEALAKIE